MDNTVKNIVLNLSKKEKDYFAKFNRLKQNKENSYYLLYKHILKNGTIDLSKLKKESKDINIFKNISNIKEKLLDKILLSMILNNNEDEHIWEIVKGILSIRILIKKEFIDKAKKYIIRTKNLAYQYEEFNLLLDIIELEESLCFNHCFIFEYNELKALKSEREKIYSFIDNYNYLLTIKAELQQFQFNEMSYNFDLDKFIEVYGHSPIILENEVLSIKAKNVWFYINAIIHFINNDYQNGYETMKSHYEFYKEFPNSFSREEYLQLLSNFLYCCSLTKNEVMFNSIMFEFLNIKNQTKKETNFIKNVYYLRTLELYHTLEKFNDAEVLAKETEKFMINHSSATNNFLTLYLNMVVIRAFIDNKNYKKAISYSKRRFETNGTQFFCTIFKIFEFISHYKLGNYENLLYSVDSWTKTIRSKRKQFPIEKVLIKFFRSVSNKVTINEKKQLIKNTINNLNEIEKTNQKFYLHHIFDFSALFERELEEMK